MKRKRSNENEFDRESKRKKINSLRSFLENSSVNPFTKRNFSPKFCELLTTRKNLPIWEAIEEFYELINHFQIIILIGSTGSGKTTQIPQFCLYHQHLMSDLSSSHLQICCTQPRRVAAISVSERVSQELDVECGKEVGYRVRFQENTYDATKLIYMTDGMLIREAMDDPLLSKYSVIILDEVHERTVQTDILLGFIKNLISGEGRTQRKTPLKLIVMSATLDAGSFQDYFPNSPTLKIPGRLHPVQILYSPQPVKDYFEAAIRTVIQIHFLEPEGDILLFLTGEAEIYDACSKIKEQIEKTERQILSSSPTFSPMRLAIMPLHASLPPEQQMKVFSSFPKNERIRKCVISTNIAETSLTINGIVYVVDPGFVKQKIYHPSTKIEALLVTEISKASAQQRAGRAGRTQPGKAFRLYTEQSFEEHLKEFTYPEVMRSNLGSVVLSMMKLGITNLVKFDFLNAPAPQTMMRALEELHILGAIDKSCKLTGKGKLMSSFPLNPPLSKCLLSCQHEVVTIVAMLSAGPIFLRPRERRQAADLSKNTFAHEKGDHLSFLNVYHAFHSNNMEKKWCDEHFISFRSMMNATRIRDQLIQITQKNAIPLIEGTKFGSKSYYEDILKGILSGFSLQVAFLEKDENYVLFQNSFQQGGGGIEGLIVKIHPSSTLRNKKPKYIMFNEFVLTSQKFVRVCSKVKEKWLMEVDSNYFSLNNFKNAHWKIKEKVKRMISNKNKKKKKEKN